MKKYLLLFTILLLLSEASNAQLPAWYQNLEKYWWYRYRLVNDFMKIGDNPGESIPAAQRYKGPSSDAIEGPDGNQGYLTNPNNPNVQQQGRLSWMDGTIRLGEYIAMLATEHKQLANNGYSVSRTEYELSKAMNAFDRLDSWAEEYCYKNANNNHPGSYPGTVGTSINFPPSQYKNGFFLRDDVPYLNFVENNFQHFNRIGHIRPGTSSALPENLHRIAGSTRGGGFGSRYRGSIPPNATTLDYWSNPSVNTNYPNVPISSSFTNNSNPPPFYPLEESQDQLAEIFAGMGLVRRLVNNNTLKQQAADMLYRGIEHTGYFYPLDWLIRNPINDKCVFGIHPQLSYPSISSCSAGGALFIASTRGATKASRMLTYDWGYPSQSLLLESLGLPTNPIFQFTQLMTHEPSSNLYSRDIMFNDLYCSFAKCWNAGIFFPLNLVNTSWKRIRNHAMSGYFATPHIPLIYKINYPGNGVGFCPQCHSSPQMGTLPSYENLLDAACKCGIYNYYNSGTQTSNYCHAQWSGNDRLSEPFHRNKDAVGDYGETNHDIASYNGLDFMELFNLYSLVKGNYLQGMFNSYYNENFSHNYPTATGLGSNTQKLKLQFLEYVSLAGTVIASNGHVTIRGGKAIDGIPGVQTVPGAFFEWKVDDYYIECDDPTYSEEYHYAYVTTPVVFPFKMANGDSSVYTGEHTEPIVYIPNGQPYVANQETPLSELEEGETEAEDLTPEQEQAAFLQIANSILNSGDADAIETFKHYFGEFPTGLGISKPNDDLQVVIVPNPNNGIFSIEFSKTGEYFLKVVNMYGSTVYQQKVNGEKKIEINMDNAVAGNYLVDITGEQKHIVQKIVVIP